jgi:hypothetical protein
VVLPAQVIWTVVYNTTSYGPAPHGTGTACFSTAQGCGYDSLNVGLTTSNSVGTDTDPDGAFWNTSTAGNYCDNGAGGTGTLRLDTGVAPNCSPGGAWTGFTPAGELQLAAPLTAPGAPRKVTAVPGNRRAVVSWKAPFSDGGSPINGYLVTPVKNGVAQPVRTFNSTATTQVVTGLTNGASYKFRVVARNAIGTSAMASSTGGITVGAPGAPSKPIVANVGAGKLKVTFKAPAPNGAPILDFTATCKSATGVPGAKTGAKSPLTVTGLTAGKTYRCRVTARNSRGTGPGSAQSNPVTA